MPFLSGIVKGILKPEDLQTAQVKVILSDIINDSLGRLDEAIVKRLKEEVAKFNAAYHMISELDKVINGYRPKVFFALLCLIKRKLTKNLRR